MQDLLALLRASNDNLRRILNEMGLQDYRFGTKSEARRTLKALKKNHPEYAVALKSLEEFE